MRFSLALSMGLHSPSPLSHRRIPGSAILAAAFACCLATGAARGGDAGQQVWLVSTRSAQRCGDLQASVGQIRYWRLDPENACGWLLSDAAAFHQGDDRNVPTTIYFHGARTDCDVAIEHGWGLYACMKQLAAGRPFRLVIWAWPADRTARIPRRDMQREAAQTGPDAYFLASTLAETKAATPLCLIGYSFGAQIAAGAMQLLAGGPMAGRCLPTEAIGRWAAGPRPVRAMFVAPAVDADSLMPGHCLGMALGQIERVLVTQNCVDRVLRAYRRLHGIGGPEAMGHSGPISCLAPGSGCERLDVADVTREVGKQHDWRLYQAAPSFVQRLGWYAFLAPNAD